MSVADLVKQLIAAGTPADVAAAVVAEAFAAGAQGFIPARSAGAERTARWRERKASQNVTCDAEASQNVTNRHIVTGSDARSPSPPVPPSFSPSDSPYNYPPSPPHPASDSARAREPRPVRGGLFGDMPDERKGWRKDWFDREFWPRYPHKVGKKAAQKAAEKVERAGVTDLDTLLAALDRYAGKNDDRPWCNPATWLNEHRFDDAPAPASTGPPRNRSGGNGFAALARRFEQEDHGDEHEYGPGDPEIIPPEPR